MMISLKRKQFRLTIGEKVEIIKRLEKGETGASLAKIYQVHAATICDIKGKKNEILETAAKLQSGDNFERRKIIKKARNLETEDAVYAWFLEMKKQGKSVSGPALCQKALELNDELGGSSRFKASSAWLRNFKYRHGVKFKDLNREAFSNDAPTAGTFRESILKMVEEEGFCMDDIYNADEIRICLKSLLCESLLTELAMDDVDFEVDEGPVTVMVCANATGQHALPLYVVAKSSNQNIFSCKTNLPIKYKVQRNAWVDYDTFFDWFNNHFLPEVRKYREKEGLTGKVLLLVDNSSSHNPLDQLNNIDENFLVRFLPPEVVQPNTQGITKKLETLYVNNFFSSLSLKQNQENLIDVLNDLSIEDCCSLLANAWKRLSKGNFQKAWQRFWKALEEAVAHEQNSQDKTDENAIIIENTKPQERNSEEEWLDDEIISHNYETEEYDSGVMERPGSTSLHADAFLAFDTVIKWCEQQPECTPNEISILKKMKDLAEEKMQSSIYYCSDND